jgi:aspartyl-tRNA(Asn)/glutamyl-tRNA(Gln) amidotransferase subunit A
MPLRDKTACEIREMILGNELSSEEAARQMLAVARKNDEKIRSILHIDEAAALERAKKVDERIAAGQSVGMLAGVPVGIKDNICVQGMPATCASRILEGWTPPYDAHVTERIHAEDGVILAKTNMDEFAMGSSTENSAYTVTANPWDTERIPGGSSGGSAAAVAARLVPMALGSDTGGSIRQPAALCGIVGLKPTYGAVSRYGLVAFASSLDQIGPLTRDVRDCALFMNVIAGHDGRDSTSVKREYPDYVRALQEADIKGVRIGLPREYFGEGLEAEVGAAVKDAIALYEKLGAEIKDITLPHADYAVATYYIIATAEASSNLARYDGVHYGHRSPRIDGIIPMYSQSREEGFGAEVKRRVMLGTYVLSAGYYDAYYLKALKVRALIKKDFDRAFDEVDLIASPTSPTAAFRIGEKTQDPLSMYLSDIYTISANLAGIPAISIPCGFTSDNLPIGLQLMGNLFTEDLILKASYAFERETDFHRKAPLIGA